LRRLAQIARWEERKMGLRPRYSVRPRISAAKREVCAPFFGAAVKRNHPIHPSPGFVARKVFKDGQSRPMWYLENTESPFEGV
jgi:hypothetical protein